MTVIAIILAGSAPLPVSSTRDLVVNMRQPHFARVRARRNCATNAGRELYARVTVNAIIMARFNTLYLRLCNSYKRGSIANSERDPSSKATAPMKQNR